MADRVRVTKYEYASKGGDASDETDYLDEIDPNDDGVDARALYLQNDSSEDSNVEISRDTSSNMTFKDGVVSGTKTLTELLAGSGGLTEESHRTVDQWVHWDLDEDCYYEVTYTSGRITDEIWWTDSGKTQKIREASYSYTGILVNTETRKSYNSGGTLVETLTITYSYSGKRIQNATYVRT